MSTQQTTETKVQRRFWIRRSNEELSWWPWGVLPLLGLGALFLIGVFYLAPRLEAQVLEQVAAQVEASGVGITDISGSGQEVALTGVAPPGRRALLESAARGTRCATWAGDLVCPTQVALKLSPPEVLVAAPPPPAPARHHAFELSVINDNLTLLGEVASEADRQRWLAAARKYFASVTDQLTLSNQTPHPDDALAQLRALETLSLLSRGRGSWRDGTLSVEGFAPAAQLSTVKQTFRTAAKAPPLGTLDVQPLVAADQCNTLLASTLSESTIQFRTGSADIDPLSQPLLEKLAELVRPCPGALRIEGHTDSVGDAASNQQLSQARAEAVREALVGLGIASERLTTFGLGESQPIADNETAAGRAANRRIVITATAGP